MDEELRSERILCLPVTTYILNIYVVFTLFDIIGNLEIILKCTRGSSEVFCPDSTISNQGPQCSRTVVSVGETLEPTPYGYKKLIGYRRTKAVSPL